MPPWLAAFLDATKDNASGRAVAGILQRYAALAASYRRLSVEDWRQCLLISLDAGLSLCESQATSEVVLPVRNLIVRELQVQDVSSQAWVHSAKHAANTHHKKHRAWLKMANSQIRPPRNWQEAFKRHEELDDAVRVAAWAAAAAAAAKAASEESAFTLTRAAMMAANAYSSESFVIARQIATEDARSALLYAVAENKWDVGKAAWRAIDDANVPFSHRRATGKAWRRIALALQNAITGRAAGRIKH